MRDFVNWMESFIPLWQANGIAKHPYIDSPIVMLDIRKIKPEHGRNERESKPVVPGAPYMPLVVDARGVLQDGYHRYYDLIDQGYVGKVPVVVYRQ